MTESVTVNITTPPRPLDVTTQPRAATGGVMNDDDARYLKQTRVPAAASELSAKASAVACKPVPLHVCGGTGVRAILQFLIIQSHHGRMVHFGREECGRMSVYGFFILSGLVSAMAATDLNYAGKKGKGKPPKLWLSESFATWLIDCGRYTLNLLTRRCLPLLAVGSALTLYYLLIETLPPPPDPTWDFVFGSWGYEKHLWWTVTPNGWFISALIWFILVLPFFLILLRGIFRHKAIRSLFIIPAGYFCYYQNTRRLWFKAHFSPYPFIGWMALSYCLGSFVTDHYLTMQTVIGWQRHWAFRLPVELAAIGSLWYAGMPPPTRPKYASNQLFFFCICLFRPVVGRMLDCRWFICVAGGTIPLLAFILHGMIGTHVFGYAHVAANSHIWFLYLAVWVLSVTFEQYLMLPVVRFTKNRFTV